MQALFCTGIAFRPRSMVMISCVFWSPVLSREGSSPTRKLRSWRLPESCNDKSVQPILLSLREREGTKPYTAGPRKGKGRIIRPSSSLGTRARYVSLFENKVEVLARLLPRMYSTKSIHKNKLTSQGYCTSEPRPLSLPIVSCG